MKKPVHNPIYLLNFSEFVTKTFRIEKFDPKVDPFFMKFGF